MTSEWSHLPNAAHIDRMLAHLKAHPDQCAVAWSAAWSAAWDAAWRATQDAARDAARGAAWGAARDDTRGAARDAARDAIAALVAWDDCAGILDMPVDAIKFLAANGHHPAVLLLPAVLVMKEIK
jgi:hypothetical protein